MALQVAPTASATVGIPIGAHVPLYQSTLQNKERLLSVSDSNYFCFHPPRARDRSPLGSMPAKVTSYAITTSRVSTSLHRLACLLTVPRRVFSSNMAVRPDILLPITLPTSLVSSHASLAPDCRVLSVSADRPVAACTASSLVLRLRLQRIVRPDCRGRQGAGTDMVSRSLAQLHLISNPCVYDKQGPYRFVHCICLRQGPVSYGRTSGGCVSKSP